jgi:hypothetical protein
MKLRCPVCHQMVAIRPGGMGMVFVHHDKSNQVPHVTPQVTPQVCPAYTAKRPAYTPKRPAYTAKPCGGSGTLAVAYSSLRVPR